MALEGKGFWIYNIRNCENGDNNAIAALAQEAQLTHVVIKIADNIFPSNVDSNGNDLVPALVQTLRAQGIQVWGYHYVYGGVYFECIKRDAEGRCIEERMHTDGYPPEKEAEAGGKRALALGLDGYIIDAEKEYKVHEQHARATRFMSKLTDEVIAGKIPIALSSYRYPESDHPEFPWGEFLEKCDYNMPQVYWVEATNAGDQLQRSIREFQSVTPFLRRRPTFSIGITAGRACRPRSGTPSVITHGSPRTSPLFILMPSTHTTPIRWSIYMPLTLCMSPESALFRDTQRCVTGIGICSPNCCLTPSLP
jgi:hypothetical protein